MRILKPQLLFQQKFIVYFKEAGGKVAQERLHWFSRTVMIAFTHVFGIKFYEQKDSPVIWIVDMF